MRNPPRPCVRRGTRGTRGTAPLTRAAPPGNFVQLVYFSYVWADHMMNG